MAVSPPGEGPAEYVVQELALHQVVVGLQGQEKGRARRW